jgi:hypothetical protein
MSLRIFGGPNGTPEKKKSYADDIVGRFRSGYQVDNGKKKVPVALTEWRVTTGDPEVAEAIASLLNGDEPQEWDASGEDNLEVFTKAAEVEVILENAKALRTAMVLRNREGKIIRSGDGETIRYPEDQAGNPDPQAGQTLAERKQAARDGYGAVPEIDVYFRLAANEDLGLFKFHSGSWSFASDLAYHDVEGQIEDIVEDNDGARVRATLSLEKVEFVAKNGPRAGQTVSYTKPVLKVKGAA